MASRGQCQGRGSDKPPLFRTRSEAARQSQCPRVQVRHGAAVSLLGTEPGSGGRTALSLCRRAGCADLPDDGAYGLRHAVEICWDCCEAERRERNAIKYEENFLVLNATRMSEELMADVVVKMFCIFRQPLIKTLCM